jgi:vacuolar protein sorting-associated protein IST1
MADLLSQSREASARIRVENIIATDITVELMEILELYAELLMARAGMLDLRDKNIKDGTITANSGEDSTGLEEAAASIIYAAPRLPRDVRELGIVRGMLIDRFGKDFALKASENVDDCVPARVVDKLKVDPPSQKLVQAYLEEIARTYGVDWPSQQEAEDVQALDHEVDGEDDDGVGGGSKEAPILADNAPVTPKPNKIDLGGLSNATPPTSLEPGGAKSPVSVAPPGARSDNLSPKLKLPGGGEVGKTNAGKATANPSKTGGSSAGAVPGKVPTVDDLAKRFSALKK